jgi:hypothetical protein
MDSFFESASSFWLLASSLVLFVDLGALDAVGAAKVAADYHSNGDADCQPYGDVAAATPIAVPMPAPRVMPRTICMERFFIIFSSRSFSNG